MGSDARPAAATTVAARTPGDFVVYRFTGSFRKAPLTLTERVVAKKGALLTIDLAATEGHETQELRVRIDEDLAHPQRGGERGAPRARRGEASPPSRPTRQRLWRPAPRALPGADSNDACSGTEEVTVDIGGAAMPAKRTTYQVHVGKRAATLRTLESATFAWGDVGGEITAADGKVLYRAEVVEAGHDAAAARAELSE